MKTLITILTILLLTCNAQANDSNVEEKNVWGDGQWYVTTGNSKVDDSPLVALMKISEPPYVTGEEPPPAIFLRCGGKKTTAYFRLEQYLGNREIEVTYRIDSDNAISSSWSISTDFKAAFAPRAINFIKSLEGHEKIYFELTPYGENTRSFTFDLKDLQKHTQKLKDACKWK